MMNKRIAFIVLGVTLVVGCCACSNTKDTEGKPTSTVEVTATPEGNATSTTETTTTPAATAEVKATPAQTTTPTNTPEAIANLPQNNSNLSSADISSEWSDMEFIFDGKKYQMPVAYPELVANGWSFNLADYGHADGYILNPDDKVLATIHLTNAKYNKDFYCKVGLTNIDTEAKDITECSVYSFSVDSNYGFTRLDNIPYFEMAKGIKVGSTKEEVFSAFGEIEPNYQDAERGYCTYQYIVDKKAKVEFTIFDSTGVSKIDLYSYQ